MEQQVNLYQPILGAEKRLFSARAIGIGLALLAACLGGLAGFAAWRTGRVERAVSQLEQDQVRQLARTQQAGAALRPTLSVAELDRQAKDFSAEITARERALEVVQRGATTPGSSFAARLEAIARRQPEGIWLREIVVGSGDGRLALQGRTVDARLVPAYLAALAEERALDGVRFDTLSMRRATAEEAPAALVFTLGAPGLSFPARELRK